MSDVKTYPSVLKRNQSKVVRPLIMSVTQPNEQPHKFMIIANAVFYNGQSADRMYLCANLVWEKEEENEYPDLPFNPKDYSVWGRFDADGGNNVSTIKLMCTNTSKATFQVTVPVDENGYFAALLPEAPAEFQPSRSGFSFVENYGGHLGEFHTVNWDTSKLTSLKYFLAEERIMTKATVNNIDTSEVTTMDYAFTGCWNLEEVNLSNWDTSKVTSMRQLFYANRALTTLNIKGWDFSKVTVLSLAFDNCESLANVIGPISGISVNLTLSASPLTAESAMVFINGLANVSSAKTLSLKASTYDALTAEQIAVATQKGWVVTRV